MNTDDEQDLQDAAEHQQQLEERRECELWNEVQRWLDYRKAKKCQWD